ncbi:MAG: beta-glucosidase [Bacteroidia bacterium]|nr:MAG: beta-glucosidase [Bacteroidia bacterium]
MKYLHILPIVGVLFLVGSCRPPDREVFSDIHFRQADSLLQLLTLEEKAGQMTNVGLTALTEGPFWNDFDTLVLDTAKLRHFLIENHIGSIQNKGIYPPSKEEWHRIIKTIQDYIAEHSRHNIPVIYGMDAVHGANYTAGSTLFPHQIGLAASWNPELARITGEVTAYEMRASSQPWNYAPVLDVSMQPLWGRIFETFGEDTHINNVMGKAFVEGQQGSSLADTTRVAVCLKHFVGYGTPLSGKDRSPAFIPEHYLRQYYIEPFRHAIDAGALTVMLNSGSVNGIPGHADKYFITDILKGELGLKGFVLSDWQDVDRLVTMHHVAKDTLEAVKIAVNAGLDMSMTPYDADFAKHVVDLVNAGEIPMSRIDDAVRRILYVKFKLGLFDAPYHDPAGYDKFGSEEFAELSYRAALESITLLKNKDQALPLKYGTNILVSGPGANALTALNGPWSRTWAGDDPSYDDPGKKTLLEALQDVYGEQYVSYTPGTDYEGDVESEAHLLRLADNADVILLALGERPATEKPSDINELDLPANQIELVKRLHKSGKPIILVFLQGRPRVIRTIEPLADAILMAYWPGHEGGRALASLLSGRENPSSKLPYTWPRYSGSLYTYQHKGSDRLGKTFDMDGFNPQWEFGYGLSYTTFHYEELNLSADTIHDNETLSLSITLTNTGNYAGKEVVQLYLRDLVASITPDNRKLIAFEKVHLEPGQIKTLDFTVTYENLQFVNLNNEWIAEKGDFEILIGGKPGNMRTGRFFLNK